MFRVLSFLERSTTFGIVALVAANVACSRDEELQTSGELLSLQVLLQYIYWTTCFE